MDYNRIFIRSSAEDSSGLPNLLSFSQVMKIYTFQISVHFLPLLFLGIHMKYMNVTTMDIWLYICRVSKMPSSLPDYPSVYAGILMLDWMPFLKVFQERIAFWIAWKQLAYERKHTWTRTLMRTVSKCEMLWAHHLPVLMKFKKRNSVIIRYAYANSGEGNTW